MIIYCFGCMKMANENRTKPKIDINGIRSIIREYFVVAIGAIVLFLSSGTMNWLRGWIYISILFLYQTIYILMLALINPQLLNERGIINWKETKVYDKAFVILYSLFSFSILVIAGFDVVRFGWSNMPYVVIYPGAVIFIIGAVFALSAYISNNSFMLTHRENKVSNQKVCKTGPYKIIRHPGYFGAVLTLISYPILLGSFFSFIPVVVCIMLFFIRTYLEDNTLQRELEGYQEYTKEVKHRLIPFVW